jgi:hypothetical protein
VRKPRPIVLITLAATLAAIVASSGAAYYDSTYAGPKTWLPGYDAHGAYDSSSDRWRYNNFGNRSTNSVALVTFIDGGGTWHDTFECYGVLCGNATAPWSYSKKPYCKNTDSISYTGRCWGTRGFGD